MSRLTDAIRELRAQAGSPVANCQIHRYYKPGVCPHCVVNVLADLAQAVERLGPAVAQNSGKHHRCPKMPAGAIDFHLEHSDADGWTLRVYKGAWIPVKWCPFCGEKLADLEPVFAVHDAGDHAYGNVGLGRRD